MSVRQYIGARYVTKVYENSLDPSSAEWEGGRAYEPLTLVTYLNSSYLSKKEVPASVGDPASNPTYWVITGAYNGQILQLQNDVSQLQTDVTAVRKKIYIMGGDSYSIENYGHTGWIDLVNAKMQLTRNVNSFDAREIVGYYGGSFAAGSFLSQLQALYTNVPDPDAISDICYFAGTNEVVYTNTEIETGISDFCSYAKTHFPNAAITIGFIGGKNTATDWNQFDRVLKVYKKCVNFGARYANFVECANYKYDDYYDALHPNDYDIIAQAIAEAIQTGSCSIYSYTTLTDSINNGTIVIQQHNDAVQIALFLPSTSPIEIPLGWDHNGNVMLDFNGPLPCIKHDIVYMQDFAYQQTGDPFKNGTLIITISPDGKVKTAFLGHSDGASIPAGSILSFSPWLKHVFYPQFN